MDAIDAEIEAGKQETYAKAKVEWAFLQGPILNRNEKRTGDSLHREGLLYMPDAEGVYRYVTSTWTVTVWQRVHNPSSKDWAVQGYEHHIPGLVSQLRSFSTIAKARDEAERLFATLTGNMVVLPWPYRTPLRVTEHAIDQYIQRWMPSTLKQKEQGWALRKRAKKELHSLAELAMPTEGSTSDSKELWIAINEYGKRLVFVVFNHKIITVYPPEYK